MTYPFKKTPQSARDDKTVMEMYLNRQITKRTAKIRIAKNNYGIPMSDEDFNELFNLGWYAEAEDKYRFEWLKKERLFKV